MNAEPSEGFAAGISGSGKASFQALHSTRIS